MDLGENECITFLSFRLTFAKVGDSIPSHLDYLANLTRGREAPDLKAGLNWDWGSSGSVSGSASAVRYDKTDGNTDDFNGSLENEKRK